MRERGERRGRPEQADDALFEHALPMVCWEDVLGLVTVGWFPSFPANLAFSDAEGGSPESDVNAGEDEREHAGVRRREEDSEQGVESVKRARTD
jgi:hypothetical protein